MNLKYLFITISLFVSLLIYVFYRTEYTIINRLVVYVLSPEHFREFRLMVANSIWLPNFVVYSLPEGLWVFAATIISGNLVLKIKRYILPMIYMPLIVALGIEFVQYTGLSKGIFDWIDIFLILVFWILAYFFNKSYQKEQTKPNNFYVVFAYTIVIFSCVWR
jgi:hypothetical protein